MALRHALGSLSLTELDIARRALDALDMAVLVLADDRTTRLYANSAAEPWSRGPLPAALRDAIDQYIAARSAARRPPPAQRVSLGGREYYLRAVGAGGGSRIEIVFLRHEVLRGVDVLRTLEHRFHITHREYQIISGLRMGKTNRQIADDLGLAEGTVARHVHRLLGRLGVPNRTGLVHLVDELVKHAS